MVFAFWGVWIFFGLPDTMRLRLKASAFLRCSRGNIALIFGLMLPVFLFAGGYTVDYAQKVSVKSDLQGVADAAALAAAKEISLANSDPQQIQKIAEIHARQNARASRDFAGFRKSLICIRPV